MIKLDLRCTNCLNKINGLKSIPSHSVDLIFVDLPYGITNFKWDKIIPANPLFEQYKRIIKDHGAILLFGFGSFSLKLYMIGNHYVTYRYKWIWVKNHGTNQINCHHMPIRRYEEINVFYKHQPTYHPQMRIGKLHNIHHSRKSLKGSGFASGDLRNLGNVYTHKYFPIDIVHFNSVSTSKNKYHRTQKPVDLLEYFIKTYTNKGDLVLDNTMGSGSTGVACVYTHRRFIGMEISQHYFNTACKRINKAQNKVMHSMQYQYQQQKYQLEVQYQQELHELKLQYEAPVEV